MPHLFHNNVESSWILPSAKMSSWYLHGSGFGDNGTLRATWKVQSYVLHDGSLRSCSQKFFLKKIKDEVTSNWAIVHRETNVYTLWNTLKWAIPALWVLHHLIHSSNTNAIGQIQQKPEPREIAPRTGKLRKLHALQLIQQIQHFTRNSKGHLLTHVSARVENSVFRRQFFSSCRTKKRLSWRCKTGGRTMATWESKLHKNPQPIGSMGLVYLPIPIKINHSCR